MKSHQRTALPSANFRISRFTTSLRTRQGSCAVAPRGKMGQRTIFAPGCFARILSSTARTPMIVSAGGSFSKGQCPVLFVPIIRTTAFAS